MAVTVYLCLSLLVYFVAEACEEAFASVWMSFYTMFLVILNMVDIRAYEVPEPALLYLVHFTYVLVVTILTINLLIGVMAEKVAHVASHRSGGGGRGVFVVTILREGCSCCQPQVSLKGVELS
jgi:uncharacterized membrane protein